MRLTRYILPRGKCNYIYKYSVRIFIEFLWEGLFCYDSDDEPKMTYEVPQGSVFGLLLLVIMYDRVLLWLQLPREVTVSVSLMVSKWLTEHKILRRSNSDLSLKVLFWCLQNLKPR